MTTNPPAVGQVDGVAASEEALIEVRDASKQYGVGESSVMAICNVSVVLRAGQRLALVGPSGSGKTTLLGLMGLMDKPDHGIVLLNGNACSELSEDALADLRRVHIGFIFQLFHLIPALTALENVMAPLLPYESRQSLEPRAHTLLRELGLDRRLGHRPGQMSGGEQQRVAIARALINHPDLILGDEPTGNLDSRTSQDVIGLLNSLQQAHGFAMVLATHDRGLAAAMDSAIQLRDGEVWDRSR